MSVRLAVFASGGGSNLQALLDAFNSDAASPVRVSLVISDRADAGALQRARDAGVPAEVVAVQGRSEGDVASETLQLLESHTIGLVALAGYLKLMPAAVVQRYPRRIVNIHPALLPGFGGKGMYGERVHRAVLASGARISGPTVHYVTEAYDEGSIIAQYPVPVLPDDTPATLAARVLAVEHRIYPLTIAALVMPPSRPAPETGAFHWSESGWPDAADLIHLIRPQPLD